MARKKRKTIDERIAALPKWAQEYVADLRLAREDEKLAGAMVELRCAIDDLVALIKPREMESRWICIPDEQPTAYVHRWSENKLEIKELRLIKTLYEHGWRVVCIIPKLHRTVKGKGVQYYPCLVEREKR